MKEFVKKYIDSSVFGALTGVLAPLISYLLILNYVHPFEFADKSLQSISMYMVAPHVLSLAAIPNLGLFFLFIYTNKLNAARGVLGATITCAIVVFVLKFST